MNIVAENKTGIILADNISLEVIANRFISYLDVSPSSVRIYVSSIRKFLKYLSERELKRPDRNTIIEYKKELIAMNCKPATVALYLSALRRFFSWCESEGLYANITAGVKSPKQDKGHKRDFLGAEQLRAMLKVVQGNTLQAKRDYAILSLMTTGGLRTVEITRANVEDLTTLGGLPVLYIQGKGRNSRTEFVKLSQPVYEAIQEYLKARGKVSLNEPLFASCSKRNRGQRLTTYSISRIAKSTMIQAGYKSERLTAHSLRHSAATLALIAGNSLQEVSAFMRHASLNTTLIYAHNVSRLNSQCEASISGLIFA